MSKDFYLSNNYRHLLLEQIQHPKGFKEDFDVSQLELGKDESLKSYEDEGKVIDVPIHNEFYSLLPPQSMDPFIMNTRFTPIDGGTPSDTLAKVREPSSQPTGHGNIPLPSDNEGDARNNTEVDVPTPPF
ncbi:hypothetical protein Salat_1166100 [Sesamum alatum]|uniref:Uncharacterized protein n=1 Tax=Sesamum alatum TaxID=300844 RepID=A0AAE1YEN7_9LAMI|nr:hypothetical protein Salat_1166100 [Sesamum alatum]